MFIIELTYKKPLDLVNEYLEQHRAFLDQYYQQGVFVASGAKKPRDGGIILAFGDKEVLNEIVKEDPFYKHGIADFRITEFEVSKRSVSFEQLLIEYDAV